ncbi:MAG: SMC-Scp complex subunit ScpB [Acutalibacteraceae bacterium]|nr:SMC-Scp complex subunit ScpB [Acutalibacteraceae bacterium]
MNINNMVSAIEAVLFAGGEPVSSARLCEVFEIDDETLSKVLKLLSNKLEDSNSGIKLLTLGDSYQLASRTEYAEYVRRAFEIRRKTPLSQAALEVLAVIAYNQPCTRSFVEQVRGVDCSGVVSTLVEKELIEERGRLELPGRPLLYGTTSTFLRSFSLSSLDMLPELPKDVAPDAKQLTFDDMLDSENQNSVTEETEQKSENEETGE